MRTILYSLCALLLTGGMAHAQLNRYSYFCKIRPVEKEGYYTLHLPGTILSESRSGFSDFRIYQVSEKDTLEVPYVENIFTHTGYADAPVGKLINSSRDAKGNTLVSFRNTSDQLHNLMVNVDRLDYDNNVSLEGSDDNKHWFRFLDSSRILGYTAVSGEPVHYNVVEFSPVSFDYIRITVHGNGKYAAPNVKVVRLDSKQYERWRQPEDLESTVTAQEGKPQESDWRIHLKKKYYVHAIRLNIPEKKDYYREYTVYTSHVFANGRQQWIYRGNGILSSENKVNGYEFSPLSQSLIAGEWYADYFTDQIRIVVHNYDDQPLKMPEVKVMGETADLIVRLEPNQHYLLAYGRSQDQMPHYDLGHFKDKIPAALSEVGLERPQNNLPAPAVPQQPLFKSNVWIWIAMGLSILLIGAFALRLLKTEKKQ